MSDVLVGWLGIVGPAQDAYWQARRDGADEGRALRIAIDVAVALATGQHKETQK